MDVYQIAGCAALGAGFAWASMRPWPHMVAGAVLFVACGYGLNYTNQMQADVYARIDAKYRATHVSDDEKTAFRCGLFAAQATEACAKFSSLRP